MEKLIALAQHLNLDILTFNGKTYCWVTLKEFNKESGSKYEFIEDIDEDNEVFKNWLIDNGNLLEDELIVSNYDENIIEYGNEEYLVVTDEEANELWDEYLDSYLEEIIYPELTGNLSKYFDDEAWKSDAKFDGRGHSLGRYDGRENYEDVERETYYIYRQN